MLDLSLFTESWLLIYGRIRDRGCFTLDTLSVSARRTRQNIKEAFWRLYKKDRIEKITIADICSVAGYNRSTFYHYFRDIHDVLDAVERELIPVDRFKGIIIDHLIREDNPGEAFALLIELFGNAMNIFPCCWAPGAIPPSARNCCSSSPRFSRVFSLPVFPPNCTMSLNIKMRESS